jgi:hypothetical protein
MMASDILDLVVRIAVVTIIPLINELSITASEV